MNIIRVLYANCQCEIIVGARRHPGFRLSAGIRQGLPWSPLLFALVGDLWLRRLKRLSPEARTRAYADDIVVVLASWPTQLRLLQAIFLELEHIAGAGRQRREDRDGPAG